MPFTVQLDAYNGPLDLLLYLVRKEEVEIAEIRLASLTDQYLAFVEALEHLDVDAVADFLDVASLLIEIKSRRVLPEAEQATDQVEEPRQDLVARLLEYKQYREAATRLDDRAVAWRRRRPRVVGALERDAPSPADQPLAGVELWDLVSAFARVMRDRIAPEPVLQKVVYDETPIHVHMRRIDDVLRAADEPVPFGELFPEALAPKSTLIGVFLAVLELIRHRHALASQAQRYGEIVLSAGPAPLPQGIAEPVTSAA